MNRRIKEKVWSIEIEDMRKTKERLVQELMGTIEISPGQTDMI